MLIEFSLEHVFSFGLKQTLDLRADQNIKAKKNLLTVKNKYEKYNLLPSSAIFGANASGKSNVLQALSMMQKLILDENSGPKAQEKVKEKYEMAHFQFSTVKKPIGLEIFFGLNHQFYFYGFSFDEEGFVTEYLIENPNTEVEKIIFKRERQNLVQVDADYQKTCEEKMADTQAFKLLLNVLSSKTNISSIFYQITDWVNAWDFSISTYKTQSREQLNMIYSLCRVLEEKKPEFFKKLKDKLRYFDTAIQDIKIIKEDGQIAVRTVHGQYQDEKKVAEIALDLSLESAGTLRMIPLIYEILQALDHGTLLCVDEFEMHLNGHIIQELLSWFWDEDLNPKGAQLVFVTHLQDLVNKKLYSWFRPDTIQIVRKNTQENSELYRLSDFEDYDPKKIRTDFWLGNYGNQPVLGF